MPVTQRVQPQLLRSLNTPLALLKGCYKSRISKYNTTIARLELVRGQMAKNVVKNSVKAVAHYFCEGVEGQYGGTVLDL